MIDVGFNQNAADCKGNACGSTDDDTAFVVACGGGAFIKIAAPVVAGTHLLFQNCFAMENRVSMPGGYFAFSVQFF